MQGLSGGLSSFHQGGIVPGPRGSDVPIIAQAGELIIPANRTGQFREGSDTNINLNFHEMTDSEFTSRLYRELPNIADSIAQTFYNRGILNSNG